MRDERATILLGAGTPGRPSVRPASGGRSTFRRLAVQDLELPALTAEQLAAVDGRPERQWVVPLPHVAALDEPARRAGAVAAQRSLQAQGLLDRNGRPSGPLRFVHELRTSPPRLALVTRFDHGRRSDRYLYGLGTVALLEERPEADGIHRFVLRSPERCGRAMAAFTDPDGRASTDGPVHDAGTSAEVAGLDAAVAGADTVTTIWVVGRRAGEPARQAAVHVVAGPTSGVWVLGERSGPNGGVSRVIARTVTTPTLAALIEGVLSLPSTDRDG